MSERKLLTEWLAFDYSPQMIKESRDAHGGKILMKGVLQKADTLNQNGRIYPQEILEREIETIRSLLQKIVPLENAIIQTLL